MRTYYVASDEIEAIISDYRIDHLVKYRGGEKCIFVDDDAFRFIEYIKVKRLEEL